MSTERQLLFNILQYNLLLTQPAYWMWNTCHGAAGDRTVKNITVLNVHLIKSLYDPFFYCTFHWYYSKKVPGSNPIMAWVFLWMFSPCLHGFSLGTLASSHSRNTSRLVLGVSRCEWMSVCLCMNITHVLSSDLKMGSELVSLISSGRDFQSLGALTEKARSPWVGSLDLGTANRDRLADLRLRPSYRESRAAKCLWGPACGEL